MKLARILIIFVVLLLVFGIGFFIFSLWSRTTSNEYKFEVDAVLTAAYMSNEGEPLTAPEQAVIAEYDGKQTVVVPGNYQALSFYLREDAATLPFLSVDPSRALKITVCDEAVFLVVPQDESGDRVWITLTTQGKTFRVRADGGNLWPSLLSCCQKGTYHDENLPLN